MTEELKEAILKGLEVKEQDLDKSTCGKILEQTYPVSSPDEAWVKSVIECLEDETGLTSSGKELRKKLKGLVENNKSIKEDAPSYKQLERINDMQREHINRLSSRVSELEIEIFSLYKTLELLSKRVSNSPLSSLKDPFSTQCKYTGKLGK